jgi:hypothetical protein
VGVTGCRRVALGFAAVTVILVPVAYVSMLGVFDAYDDEGYFLMTLRDYMSGHALYSQVSTIYGPFFYEVMGGAFKLLGLEVGNDTARAFTIVVWLVASLAGGVAAFRITRSLLLGLGAQFVTFHVLAALTSEPGQPSGILSLLLIGLVAATAYGSAHPRAMALLIGSIVAAACLVKINVGVFAGLAVAFALAAGVAGPRRKVFLIATGLLLVASPFVLMAGLLGRDWVVEYALVAGLSAATVAVACLSAPPVTPSPPTLAWLIAGGAALAVLCVGIAVLGGTNPGDLFSGLVVAPLRLPQLFVLPLRINVGYVVWAAASLALAAAILGRRAGSAALLAVPGLARIFAGALTWLTVLLLPSSALFFVALPLAWVATRDPRRDTDGPTNPYARLLLPALAVTESLQAYPIAGTQLSIAALVLVPVGAITLNDGIRQLRGWSGRESRQQLLTVASWVAPALLIANIAFVAAFAFLAFSGYESTQPLGLRGAESMRVIPQRAAALRSLVAAINQGCTSFITLPGMAGFYLWTGQQPPAQLYSGPWMYFLDSAQQEQVVSEIQGQPRLCVVKDQAVVDFWAEGRPVPNGPLIEYIDNTFTLDRVFGDYELLVAR